MTCFLLRCSYWRAETFSIALEVSFHVCFRLWALSKLTCDFINTSKLHSKFAWSTVTTTKSDELVPKVKQALALKVCTLIVVHKPWAYYENVKLKHLSWLWKASVALMDLKLWLFFVWVCEDLSVWLWVK